MKVIVEVRSEHVTFTELAELHRKNTIELQQADKTIKALCAQQLQLDGGQFSVGKLDVDANKLISFAVIKMLVSSWRRTRETLNELLALGLPNSLQIRQPSAQMLEPTRTHYLHASRFAESCGPVLDNSMNSNSPVFWELSSDDEGEELRELPS